MQYSEINKFEKTDSFFVFDNSDSYIVSQGRLIKYDTDFSKVWDINYPTNWNLSKFDDKVLYSFTQYQRIVFFDCISGSVLQDTHLAFRPLCAKGGAVYGNYLSENSDGNAEFSFGKFAPGMSPEVFSNTKDFAGILYSVPYTICQNGYAKFNCYQEQKLLWEIDFAVVLKNENVALQVTPVIADNKLFFFLADSGTVSAIYIADLDTGELLHHNDNFGGALTLVNQKIYIANEYTVQFMDTVSFEVQTIDLASVLKPSGVAIEWDMFRISGKYLYFSNSKTPGIGVLNLNERVLEWYTELYINNDNLQKVIKLDICQGRIYALCTDKVLHVFGTVES